MLVIECACVIYGANGYVSRLSAFPWISFISWMFRSINNIINYFQCFLLSGFGFQRHKFRPNTPESSGFWRSDFLARTFWTWWAIACWTTHPEELSMDPSKLLEIIKATRPAAWFVRPCVFVQARVWVSVWPQNLLLIFVGPVSGERFGGIIGIQIFFKGTTRVSTMQLQLWNHAASILLSLMVIKQKDWCGQV